VATTLKSITLYLASQSPRRLELIRQLGIEPRLLLADSEENIEALEDIQANELPIHYVKRVAKAKAAAAWQRLEKKQLLPAPILCADTTVALEQEILGKPQSAEHAFDLLQQLSGRSHVVYTSVVLQLSSKSFLQKTTRSHVTFALLKPEDIKNYIASGEPMDKAGAYGIQGLAAQFVRHIAGSYTGIIGLPLYETKQLLNQAGLFSV
jgi:septum formation protein